MNKETDAEKRNIRKHILDIRNGLSTAERERAAVLLTERILGHQWFYRAEDFLCFVSYGSEIDTWEILREALRMGKKVYVPKVLQKETAKMQFYRIRAVEELAEGYKGILEPSGSGEEYSYKEDRMGHTMMLMPGVAFDQFKNRIGYGRGFYDRFLADKAGLQLHTIAVGYKCQMADKLPASENDIKPYQVICV